MFQGFFVSPITLVLCAFIIRFPQKIHPAVTWKYSHEFSAVARDMRMKTRSPGSALDTTAQRSLAENRIHFFFLFLFLVFFSLSSGSRKHQRQTWVGSKCSLKKPTTLRNGRPNSSPWWRAKTKFGTRACIHFPGVGCLRQLPLSNDSVLNSSFF